MIKAAVQPIDVETFQSMDFEEADSHLYELINGEIVKRSVPGPKHQEISMNFSNALYSFVKQKELGKVYTAPTDVYLDKTNAIQPDIFFIRKENLAIVDKEQGIVGVPDLVVEIVSPSSVVRDRVDKKEVYQKTGVQEYWIVDPNNTAIEVYHLEEGAYKLHSAASVEGAVQSKLLEGFELKLHSIFQNK